MKRCPECRRNYYDETLLYCLDDGTALLEGPGSGGHETAILSGDEFADNAKTRPLISSPGSSSGAASTAEVKSERSLPNKIALAAAAAVIVAGLVGLGFFISRSRTAPQSNPVSIKLEKLTSQGNTL